MVDGVMSVPTAGNAVNFDADRGPVSGPAVALGDFVVGPENRLALAAVEAVLEDGAPQWSPVVFYGPHGVGKSHLALGLVTAWKARQRRAAVYATAVNFARELGNAIDTQATDDFQARYRQVSLLVVDDVHWLASKQTAQEELICVLDALADVGSRVVLTTSASPEGIEGIVPRLASRMVAGLVVPLALPGPEARRAILLRQSQAHSITLDPPVLDALVTELSGPVPRLEGAIAQLELMARTEGSGITLDLVRRQLATGATGTPPSLRDIAAATARDFSVKMADLRSPSRRRAVVIARGVAMYLARTLTGKSLKQIGKYFADRDHTTVSHGCLKTEGLLKSDPAIRAAVERLRDRLQPVAP